MDININHRVTIEGGLNQAAKDWIMATIEELNAKVAEVGAKVQAAADRAIANSQSLNTQIADLRSKLEASGAPPETMAALQAIEDTADKIDPTTATVLPADQNGATTAPTSVPAGATTT